MATLTPQQRNAMNTRDEQFFRELGARIALARKELQLTQQQLAEQLGIAQQTMAHYEGGRLKVSASLLPQLTQILNLSLDELLGLPTRRTAKRGPTSCKYPCKKNHSLLEIFRHTEYVPRRRSLCVKYDSPNTRLSPF